MILSCLLPIGSRAVPIFELRLPALAVVFAVVGGMLAGWMARRPLEGDRRDLLASSFAGGLFGLLAAAVAYALIRSVELPLGGWSSSLGAVELVWAVMGAAFAGISIIFIPYHPDRSEVAP